MSFYPEYFRLQEDFTKKYGDKTVILMQKGAHYQIYEYDSVYEKDGMVTGEVNGNLVYHLALNDDKNLMNDENVVSELPHKGTIGKAREISQILGMKLTSPDKSKPHSKSNPFMMGFPHPSYEGHRDIILLNGYTIVRVDEVGDDSSGKGKARDIVEITSPGTEINKSIGSSSNLLASIYIEYQKQSKPNPDQTVIVCGLSYIDMTSGETSVSEVYSRADDPVYPIQEIYRFLSSYQPVEIILHLDKVPTSIAQDYLTYIISSLDLDRYCSVITHVNGTPTEFMDLIYQEQFLRKAFPPYPSSSSPYPNDHSNKEEKVYQTGISGPIGPIEELDLEKFHYGRISYICLLQHCYEHRESLIQKLQKPKTDWTDEHRHLILTHNAIDQLDLLPKNTNPLIKSNNIDSLLKVLDSTSTEMGKRFLKRRLINPITQIEELDRNYQMTDELIQNPQLLSDLETKLKLLPDVEKLHRKVQLEIIKPKELVILIQAYSRVMDIYTTLFNFCYQSGDNTSTQIGLRELFLPSSDTTEFNICLQQVHHVFNLKALNQVQYVSRLGGRSISLRSDCSFVNSGVDPDIDRLDEQVQECRDWLTQICNYLNGFIPGSRSKKVEIFREKGDQSEPILVTSKASANHLQTANKSANWDPNICGQLDFINYKSGKIWIRSDQITAICSGCVGYQNELENRLLSKYQLIVSELAEKNYFSSLNLFLAKLDFLSNGARIAIKYRYHRPVIDRSTDSSYIQIKNLRHPLIERIINTEYIPNDIELGKDYLGTLQYGVNSTGKTSLAKAIGLAVIMIQAGLYAAGEVTYHPYLKMITRLSGHDDIIKGHSSFVVEMMELRTIHRNADHKTLVFGDELCRGTETISGEGIACSAIEELIEKGSSFIFSTHMHGLVKMSSIKKAVNDGKLRVSHLSTYYDAKTEKLVYDRKLTPGSGPSVYGLEVCKSLQFDPQFIQRAQQICREISGQSPQFVSTKKSRYSSKVYMDECSICKTKFKLNTHHLTEQSKADNDGYIDHYHKNSPFNLLVLCESCHHQIHSVKTPIKIKQSLDGTYLDIESECESSDILNPESDMTSETEFVLSLT